MTEQRTSRPAGSLIGRTFLHPALDYLLIGGGLSLITVVALYASTGGREIVPPIYLPIFMLLANSAHFAASTTRLYTKPGARQALPFLAMVMPMAALGFITLCIAKPDILAPGLQSLYLTWSPYHYAAQAYGLAVMYSYRSGCAISDTNKKLLWWFAMVPFFYNFLSSNDVGLRWLLPDAWVQATVLGDATSNSTIPLGLIAFLAPVFLFFKIRRDEKKPMPLISLLILFSNAIWLFVLPPLQAFVWATIFHSLQYLAIVAIFHVKDQVERPDNRHGGTYHTLWFYGASVLLGYMLFQCLPRAYTLAGFGMVESSLVVIAVINIHHFWVDGYIWRLKPSDGNRRIVDSAAGVVSDVA